MEHNALEGLPISQYREVEVTIGPNPTESKQLNKNDWPEPPMPRDFNMLQPHSQQLLRSVRSGRIHKPPAPPEEDKEPLDEEEEHKEVRQGFTIKKWVKVPRHLEEPEPEYLAKRRKGLPSQYVANGQTATQPPAMRETKIKKTDAEGNVAVYKALVPEGQAVEGEVQPTDAIGEAAPTTAAPGTVVEGVGVVNAEGVIVANDLLHQTPPRRRPPPPKKKKKSGPGRGKKKVVFAEGATDQGTPLSGTGSDLLTVPHPKLEGSVEPSEGGDTPMPDAGDDDEGSGEEGSDEEEQEEGTHSPTPVRRVSPSKTPEATSAPIAEPPEKPVGEAALVLEEAPATSASLVALIPASERETVPAPIPQPENVAPENVAPLSPAFEPDNMEKPGRDSSSPELPLSAMSHSRTNSLNQIPTIPPLAPELAPEPTPEPAPESVPEPVPELVSELVSEPVLEPAPTEAAPAGVISTEAIPAEATSIEISPIEATVVEEAPVLEPAYAPVSEPAPVPISVSEPQPIPLPVDQSISDEVPASDGEPDLLGSLERQLEQDSESMANS